MNLFSPLHPSDPTSLGRFKLLGRLGEGGMGVVFLGQDEFGHVAVKTIRAALTDDANVMRRFCREVDAAKRVPRHCTAQVYEDDLEHRPAYIVTEYIKGPRSGRRSPPTDRLQPPSCTAWRSASRAPCPGSTPPT